MKPFIAEFIGTFTLIFIGVGAIAADKMSGGHAGLVGIALAHGLAIGVMVSATAAVSGGHLNPAVTFGALLGGKIKFLDAVGYVISQCLGAFAAAMALNFAARGSALVDVHFGVPELAKNITPAMGVVMEAILTFFLVFVVYGTAIDKRAPKVGGLFIGLTIAMGVLAGGPVTGAAINPARHFGPAFFNGYFANMWVYWVGPLLGGGLAGLVYHFALEEPEAAASA